MNRWWLAWLIGGVASSGCGGNNMAIQTDGTNAGGDGATFEDPLAADTDDEGVDASFETYLGSFLVEVSATMDPADQDGVTYALDPQSFGPFLGPGKYDLDMLEPVRVFGRITADQVTPWLSTGLPTTLVDVEADIVLTHASNVQSVKTGTDENGYFDIDVVPDLSYGLAVIPDDPTIAPILSTIAVLEDTAHYLGLHAGQAGARTERALTTA